MRGRLLSTGGVSGGYGVMPHRASLSGIGGCAQCGCATSEVRTVTATINVQFSGLQDGDPARSAVSTAVSTAFAEWLRHFDYTAGNYQITAVLGFSVPDVRLGVDAYVRVGTSNGTAAPSMVAATSGRPIIAARFGLNVAARNGVSPPTSPLYLYVNTSYYESGGDLVGPLEREFEHALGVFSSRGTAPTQPVPAGTVSIYDGNVFGTELGLQTRPPSLPLFFGGPNAEAAFAAAGGIGILSLNPLDGSITAVGNGTTVNTSFAPGAASRLQPLDVALLRDSGLPALTDQELGEHQVARLYFGAFGRVADGAGLVAAYEALQAAPGSAAAASLAGIAAGLVSSAEFAGRYGALADADYVRTVYQNVFGRAVNGATLAAITGYLAGQGAGGRGAVLAALTEMDEARGRLSDNANITYSGTAEAQVARLYETAFGRGADPGGFAQYTRAVVNGFTLRQAALSFLGSGEFAARYGASPSDQTLVDGLYRNTLGRAPDAAGAAQYLRALASGGFSRADLVVAFSESGEHISLMAQRADARDVAGRFLDTAPRLGVIPVISGTVGVELPAVTTEISAFFNPFHP